MSTGATRPATRRVITIWETKPTPSPFSTAKAMASELPRVSTVRRSSIGTPMPARPAAATSCVPEIGVQKFLRLDLAAQGPGMVRRGDELDGIGDELAKLDGVAEIRGTGQGQVHQAVA